MSLSDAINILIALGTICASVVALCISSKQIKENKKSQSEQIEENQNSLKKQLQFQSSPVIVPIQEEIENVCVPPDTVLSRDGQLFYISEVPPSKGNINWGIQADIPIKIQNIGTGPVFNIHCIFYGGSGVYSMQFVSWDNGPIGPGKTEIINLHHPIQNELLLSQDESIDGKHPLYYPFGGKNPNHAMGCLTITYRDIFGNRFVSIFDYVKEHQWICVYVSDPWSTVKFDLKELNEQKRH